MKLYAHYFASKTTKFVIISTNAVPSGEKIPVSGKAEARKLAKQAGAECWNF